MLALLVPLLLAPPVDAGPPDDDFSVETRSATPADACTEVLSQLTTQWRICLTGDAHLAALRRQQTIDDLLAQAHALCPLSRESIQAIFRGHRQQTELCYQQQLQANHDLAGRVEVVLAIGADGTVITAFAQNSTLANPALEACLVGKVKAWKFPKPPTAEPVRVVYPLVFQPE